MAFEQDKDMTKARRATYSAENIKIVPWPKYVLEDGKHVRTWRLGFDAIDLTQPLTEADAAKLQEALKEFDPKVRAAWLCATNAIMIEVVAVDPYSDAEFLFEPARMLTFIHTNYWPIHTIEYVRLSEWVLVTRTIDYVEALSAEVQGRPVRVTISSP